jgi:perosamine synthetase
MQTRPILAAIERVLGPARRPVALHEPRFGGREWEYLKRCLDSGWVSSAGTVVDELESRLASLCGVRHAVATVNGTAALHAALHVAGVGAGDEVLVPALTFVATVNAVAYCGATPHFVDSTPSGLGIDPARLDARLRRIAVRRGGAWANAVTGRRLRAVVPVHVFGHPADMDALGAVAREFGLAVVEDATEALGSRYRGRPCGSLGGLGVLSFNGNKIVTTGGGGALLTDEARLAERARHLASTAKLPHKWSFVHDEIGWNYRLPSLNAALGLAQLEQLEGFVRAKRSLAGRYAQAFASVTGTRFLAEPDGAESNYWLNAILLDDGSGAARDALLEACHAARILARPLWTLMHQLPMFRDCPRDDLSIAESIERRLVNLPSSAALTMD